MSRFTTPDSYLLKLHRAKEHRDAVERMVRAHMDVRRERFADAEIDAMTGQIIVISPDIDFDTSIFLAAADCVVNVRACLDHLVCQVAAVRRVDATKQAFPICDRLDEFNDCIGKGFLKGVPFDAIAVIEAQQPYDRTTGIRNELHPLFALRELSNTDKHRALYFASPDLRDLQVTVTSGSGQEVTLTAEGPIRAGQAQVIGTVPFIGETTGTINVQCRAIKSVTYEEFPVWGVVVTELLTRVIDHVETMVLPPLKPFARI
jgi:hypothetical protein